MRNVSPRIFLRIGAAVAAMLIASSARAAQIQFTVTNDQPTGGFALAPVWFGLQNSSTFSPFTPGSSASSAIASLAQTGSTAALTSLFSGMGPETTLTSGNTIAQFTPGQSNSTILNISNPSADQYLSYAGMVVPSNDFFQGNATALQIFNANGSFIGPMTIHVYGSSIWDSDTEAQSTTTALTFIAGQNPGTGMQIGNGMITSLFSEPNATTFLNSIIGLNTIAGYTITNVPTSGELLATIQINSVPEPTSIVLFGMGVIGLVVVGRSRRMGKSRAIG
jgi:PEP-CTERM motif/Spondin_N